MKKFARLAKKWFLLAIGIIIGVALLALGPLLISYVFFTETIDWEIALPFSAGDMLLYYGTVLGGVVTCFAIITTIHINSKNRRQDLQRQQFERAYALYHRLPDILARLELEAIHVQYSVNLHEDKLIATLDTMKKIESVLREHHFSNDTYYSKDIESMLKSILVASVECQESVERFLQAKKDGGSCPDIAFRAMEALFLEFRESIKKAKGEIVAEINQFVSVYDGKVSRR